MRNIKKNEQPHAGCMSIHYCYVKMTSPCQMYVASQHIQHFLEVVFVFFFQCIYIDKIYFNEIFSDEKEKESIVCVMIK